MAPSTTLRRDRILSHVLDRGHVTVKALADSLDVSEATVRRDLRTLADSGELELVYGGATVPRATDFSVRSKALRNVEAKRLIGGLAASLVADGDTLLIDSGTTTFEMVAHLKRRRGLTAIVNSLRLAVELGSNTDFNIVALGGQYRRDAMDTVGPMALDALAQLRGFRALIGADGLSMEFGVAACDIDSAHLYKTAMHHAREVIVLVDHTKFLAPSLYKISDFDDVSRIVTDRVPTPEWMEFFHEKGVEVHYPAFDSPQFPPEAT